MPTTVFASSKGGVGKSTSACLLASELAIQGMTQGIPVILIDADPNQHSAKWALRPGCPKNIVLVQNSTEETIVDDIDVANQKGGFVIVDLEGAASMTVASAVSRADLVIIPCQGSQDDADEAAKTIRLINRQSKVLNRQIPFAVLFTRTNAAITPRTLRFITDEFVKAKVDVFETSLIDREAYRAIRSFGGTVNDLDPREVSGIERAIANAKAYTEEVKRKLKNSMTVKRVANGN